MSELIDVLRGMCDAGTADYSIGTANYWDGDQIQRVLDRHRVDFYEQPLTAIPRTIAGGTVVYTEYAFPVGNLEQTQGGTAVFYMTVTGGSVVGTANYTPDYLNGKFSFGTVDQGGTAFYITGRTYDMNAAAADIWGMKAANVAKAFNFSTDNHRVDRGALMKQYQAMQAYYQGQVGIQVGEIVRPDNNVLINPHYGNGDGQW